jgi:hypothetical protein
VAGTEATFAAGVGSLSTRNWSRLSYRWRIGRDVIESATPKIVVRAPGEPCVLSVAVEVVDGDDIVAFGAVTTSTLTRDEATRLQIIQLLREIAAPGDPSGVLVQPTRDPLEAALEINRINMPWMGARAVRLAQLLEALLNSSYDMRTKQGKRYLEDIRAVLAAADAGRDGR